MSGRFLISYDHEAPEHRRAVLDSAAPSAEWLRSRCDGPSGDHGGVGALWRTAEGGSPVATHIGNRDTFYLGVGGEVVVDGRHA